MTKQYLGDHVYVDFDGQHVILTAEDVEGSVTDTILLEPYVFADLFFMTLRQWPELEGKVGEIRAIYQLDRDLKKSG